MLAFYFKSAVVVNFCFDLNICCLLVLANKLEKKEMCTKFLDSPSFKQVAFNWRSSFLDNRDD